MWTVRGRLTILWISALFFWLTIGVVYTVIKQYGRNSDKIIRTSEPNLLTFHDTDTVQHR
jgi:hypothetical protein